MKALNSNECLFQFFDDVSIRFSIGNRDAFFNAYKQQFSVVKPGSSFGIYGIPKDTLKDLKSNNKNHHFDNEPPAKFRLKDEELNKDDESMLANIDLEANLEQLGEDFNFENRNSIAVKGSRKSKTKP